MSERISWQIRCGVVSERKGRVKDITKTLSQNNGKNGVAVNVEAEGAGEEGRSGAHEWTGGLVMPNVAPEGQVHVNIWFRSEEKGCIWDNI